MILRRNRPSPEAQQPQASELPAGSLSALLTASQAVTSVLQLGEALKVVLHSARELLQAHQGSVMLLEAGELRILAGEGLPKDVAENTVLKLGEGVAGKVAQTGTPLLLDKPPSERDFESFVAPDRPITSAIVVPLKASGTTVGVLNLNRVDKADPFTDDDFRIAQVFAEQAALAIYRAKLLDVATKRGEDLSLMLEVSKALLGVLELEPLMNRILDGAVTLVGSRAGFLALHDEATSRLSLVVFHGIARHEVRDLLMKPGFLDEFSGDAKTRSLADSPFFEGLGSDDEFFFMTPLRIETRTRGLLLLIGPSPDADRLDLSKAYFAQAALAIRNAQLYAQVDEKETELASIVYSIPNPMIVVDSKGRLVAANPAAEELFAFTTDFQKGNSIAGSLGHPELEELLTGDSNAAIEVQAGMPETRIWSARASSILTPDAKAGGGRVLVMHDVSTQKDMERMKGDFVAIIGHELRTPLTLIKGYLKTLMMRGDDMKPESRLEALETAEAQARRLERLIEDLLYVSQIETSRPDVHVEAVDLVDIANEILREFKAREPKRTFNFTGPSSLPATADRTKCEQILFHLIDNAVKYSDDEDPVEVAVAEKEDVFSISVKDEGIGILSEDIDTVFQRFHQVDTSSTRRYGGTGVGLYICKAFVEAHGGRIKVESAWGRGSKFTFTLPKNLKREVDHRRGRPLPEND
jgi:PAS domain S-box-containing protein